MVDATLYRPCVGIMLMNKDGRVFVGSRIDNPDDAWQMPQGGVDEGESLEQAALRELEEEVGVPHHLVSIVKSTQGWLYYDLPEALAGTLWGGKYKGQRQQWFLMRFLGDDGDVNIETDIPEFSEWQWVEAARLPELIVPFKRELYAKLLTIFSAELTS